MTQSTSTPSKPKDKKPKAKKAKATEKTPKASEDVLSKTEEGKSALKLMKECQDLIGEDAESQRLFDVFLGLSTQNSMMIIHDILKTGMERFKKQGINDSAIISQQLQEALARMNDQVIDGMKKRNWMKENS